MRLSLTVVMVLVLLNSQHQKNKPQPTQQTTITDQRGTQESPIVVKVLPAQKAPEETVQDAEDRKNKRENDGNIVDLTAVLAIVAVLQLGVYGYQSYQLTKTVRSAGEQSAAMDRHIDEAARSATAMETIAATIQTGNRAIMRAYLTVNIGGGTYQERNRVGQADIKFAVGPTVANTGNTHARNVRIRKKAAFFPSVLPNDFAYEELGPETEASFATVAAHQSYTINAVVDDFVPDTEVSLIKVGDGTNLHVWGKIIYEDIFGDTHITKFGQWIVFVPPNNQILGWYTPGQNDAD